MKHRIRVSGIAVRGNEVLLVEQVNPKTGHKRWGSPGGGLELSDPDIYRSVEREMLEETGLQVRAGQLRFVNEFYHQEADTLMLDMWIDCHPVHEEWEEISMANQRHDDYISDVRWWTKEAFIAADHKASLPLLKEEFWEHLFLEPGKVVYLGRWSE